MFTLPDNNNPLMPKSWDQDQLDALNMLELEEQFRREMMELQTDVEEEDDEDEEEEKPFDTWQLAPGAACVSDAHLRKALLQLEEKGVEYETSDVKTLRAKYLGPVASKGDCQFLALERAVEAQLHMGLTSRFIRHRAVEVFLEHYKNSSAEIQSAIDSKIQHLYFPTTCNWDLMPLQTLYYVAAYEDYEEIEEKVRELESLGVETNEAKEMVYSEAAYSVSDATAYAVYMSIRGKPMDKYFIVAMTYSAAGLLSVSDSLMTTAWGDDIILEAVATIFDRNIAVVLIHNTEPIVLNHEPYDPKEAKTQVPLVLLMASTGNHNGGDHYDPLVARFD